MELVGKEAFCIRTTSESSYFNRDGGYDIYTGLLDYQSLWVEPARADRVVKGTDSTHAQHRSISNDAHRLEVPPMPWLHSPRGLEHLVETSDELLPTQVVKKENHLSLIFMSTGVTEQSLHSNKSILATAITLNYVFFSSVTEFLDSTVDTSALLTNDLIHQAT